MALTIVCHPPATLKHEYIVCSLECDWVYDFTLTEVDDSAIGQHTGSASGLFKVVVAVTAEQASYGQFTELSAIQDWLLVVQ